MHKPSSPHDRRHQSGPHFPSSLPQVRLEIRRGKARNLVRDVSGPVYLIGRARDCDLVLGDEQFPEAYAYVFISDSAVTLRRLGEGPDLTVNGRVVRNVQLHDGDRIRTGPFEFHVRIVWPLCAEDSRADRPRGRRRPELNEHQQELVERRVAALLSDIRQAMFPPQVGLRVYVGSHKTIVAGNSPQRSRTTRATA
jgi:pSer/pThr/pTyr-binding forkhead associated (FHA) protein